MLIVCSCCCIRCVNGCEDVCEHFVPQKQGCSIELGSQIRGELPKRWAGLRQSDGWCARPDWFRFLEAPCHLSDYITPHCCPAVPGGRSTGLSSLVDTAFWGVCLFASKPCGFDMPHDVEEKRMPAASCGTNVRYRFGTLPTSPFRDRYQSEINRPAVEVTGR